MYSQEENQRKKSSFDKAVSLIRNITYGVLRDDFLRGQYYGVFLHLNLNAYCHR